MKSNSVVSVGLSLRDEHLDQIIQTKPSIPWFEILIDNYLSDSVDLSSIDQIAQDYPLAFHGIGLSIGSHSRLDFSYLAKIKQLHKRWQFNSYSDHLSWSSNGDKYFHELLPLPNTRECINHLVGRIQQVQEFLGEQILMENPSTYIEVPSEMPEWDFVNSVCRQAGCGLLLDINNVQVNAFNHGYSAFDYIENVDKNIVEEIHLSGYEDYGSYLFDSHGRAVSNEVWELFYQFTNLSDEKRTLIEWDNNIPSLSILMNEAEKAKRIIAQVNRDKCGEVTCA